MSKITFADSTFYRELNKPVLDVALLIFFTPTIYSIHISFFFFSFFFFFFN
jgi:hypothetical protein